MKPNKKILVVGGTGYIGSHAVIELLNTHHDVVVYDNLSNSSKNSLERVYEITGKRAIFIHGDVRDSIKLDKVFRQYKFDGVMHFAGLKSVSESIEQPIRYYNNNVFGTLQLLEVMERHNVKIIVFSSSATVYGNTHEPPFHESMPTDSPTNPYGMSKLIVENILSDLYKSDKSWSIANLRYFNPVGAHPSGLIGEDPRGVPNNIMPLINKVALQKIKLLNVYGGDYPTLDGSAIRDYIHVVDLAQGHLAALNKCYFNKGVHVINLGSGNGTSVLQLVKTFERVNNVSVPYTIVDRRKGDVAKCYAQVEFAKKNLNWGCKLGLEEICRDSWKWQCMNPDGLSED